MPKRKREKPPRPVTPEALRALRAQLGTKELARRMGIPAPSLRRLLGKGKGAGFPKQKPVWEESVNAKGKKERVLVKGHAFSKLVQQVGMARASEQTRKKQKAFERVKQSIHRGTFDQDFYSIADELGMTTREVYTLGVSPD